MKKFKFLFCALAAIVSCNQVCVDLPEAESDHVLNETTDGSVPISFKISGGTVQTKGVTTMASESALTNVRMTVKGYSESNVVLYSEEHDLGTQTNGIVNVKECHHVVLSVFSGNRDDSGYIKTLEGQSDYFYAEGSRSLSWNEVQAQEGPLEILVSRKINKITIEKISVSWNNPNYDSKEFKIKKIFLCDIPRTYIKDAETSYISVYKRDYSQSKEDIKYYNMGGLDGYSYYDSTTAAYYDAVTARLDNQLLDQVDVTVSENSPYIEPHVFYTYINNSSRQRPQMRNATDRNNGVITVFPAMSTIAIEAEMEGQTMYYRFQIFQSSESGAPVNTHIRFKELLITELGAPSLYEAKTFKNAMYEFAEWDETDIDVPVESL